MADNSSAQKPMDVYLRILILSLLLVWCLLIARPFLVIIVWAIIIAVAIYPIYKLLLKLFRGRRGLAVASFIVVILTMVVLPSLKVAGTIVRHTEQISAFINNPKAQIPRPNQSVESWPVVGDKVYAYWTGAYDNFENFVAEHSEEVTKVAGWFVKGLGTVVADIIVSLFSLVMAGFLLYNSNYFFNGTMRFAERLIGDKGDKYVIVARDTIKSVVQGILLVALIQALLAYAGFAIMGIKGAALFALLIMILAIVQLPVVIITIPMAIYGFTIAGGTAATIFAVYMLVIGLVDNVLRPFFLGRGVDIPMIILLVGSLGGMMLHGILGLFLGAVVLAIGYQTYMLWIDFNETVAATTAPVEVAAEPSE